MELTGAGPSGVAKSPPPAPKAPQAPQAPREQRPPPAADGAREAPPRQRCRRQPSCEDNDCANEGASGSAPAPPAPPAPANRRRRRKGGCAAAGRSKRARSPDTSSSSDTGNDDYSVGEDECYIYTYRGGERAERMADLRSSFFSLDVGPAAEPHLPAPPLFGPNQIRQEAPNEERPPSSPDMDYLEMDFDPGPSCEVDSDDDSGSEGELDAASNSKLFVEETSASPEGDDAAKKESNLDAKSDPAPAKFDRVESSVTNSFSSRARDDSPSEGPGDGRRSRDSDFRDEPSTSEMNLPSTSGVKRREEPPAPDRRAEELVERDPRNGRAFGSLIPHATPSGKVVFVRRTRSSWPTREIRGHHNSSGDLVSPGEVCEADLPDSFSWTSIGRISPKHAELLEASRVNRSSALFHCTMAKKLIVDIQAAKFLQENDTSNVDGSGLEGSEEPSVVPKQMVWTEQEACSRQITQIGTSACGATAVINVLLALQQIVDVECVTSAVGTRLRANNAPLSRYIISRAIAGCDVTALAAGLHAGSGGAVSSRHFSMWPERAISLSHWLAYWIELGGVPIATLNLQAGVVDTEHIPDSWHHQMIFGVGPRGIYMTNPVDRIEEGTLWHQLCSDSILLIKRKDILSRWNRDTDLTPLIDIPGDERWKTMNVLGQVVNMVRESQNTNSTICTTHIRIPACYSAGITIAVLTGSDAHKRLLQAPELPLLIPEDE